MPDAMAALVYDRRKDPWATSRGLRREEVARPRLDPARDYHDGAQVLIRPRFAGFCGSDRGIWFRRSFGEMIADSLDAEGRDVRVVGHALLGGVVEVGP